MAVVTISLDVDAATGTAKLRGVGSELRKTGQEALSVKGLVSSVFQGLGQGVGIAAVTSLFSVLKSGAGTLAGMVGVAGDYAGALLKVEAATGLNAKAQAALMQAGKDVGVSWESQRAAIGNMAAVLDAHPEKLRRIGMSYKDLEGMDPAAQFEEIGKKIAAIEDPTRRLTAAQEIFGKKVAQEVIPLFSGAITKAREDVEKFGLAMKEDAIGPLDDLSDTVGLAGEVWDAFMRNIAGVIAQSQPLHTLFSGLLDLLGRLSKSTQDNTGDMRTFVDNGVVRVAQSLVTLVDVIQTVMDFVDVMRVGFKELYVLLLGLAIAATEFARALALGTPGGRAWAEALQANITMMKAEQVATRNAAVEVVDANIKRTNALQAARGEVEKLAKAVEAGVGQTYKAAAAEEAYGKAIGGTSSQAEAARKAHEAFVKERTKMDEAAADDHVRRMEQEFKERDRLEEEALKGHQQFVDARTKMDEAAADDHVRRMEEEFKERERLEEEALAEAARQAAVRKDALFDGLANVLDLVNPKLGEMVDIVHNLADAWEDAKTGADKFYLIAAAIGQIGSVIGGTTGSTLQGAAGGAMSGFSMGGPIGAVIGGLIGGLTGLFSGKSKEKAKRAEAEKSAISSLDALAQRLEKFKTETLQGGVAGVNALMGYLADKTDLSAERMARMGTIGFGVFQMLRNSGMGIVQAMNAMGPAFDAALKAGADGFGAKFAELAAFRQLVLDNSALVTAAESIGDVINAYRVNGMLTQQMFNDLIGENRSLVEDMLAQGFTLDQALAVNAKSLYAIYKAQQDIGLVVDETTQKYIDQAEKAGLFDDMKDPMEELVEIQKMMLEIMSELVKVMGGALPASVQAYIDKLNQIPRNVNTTVNTDYTRTGDPGDGHGGDEGSGGPGLPEMAMGGISTRPQAAMLHGSPSNPEVVAPVSALIRGIGQAVAEGSGGGGVQVGQIVVYVPEGVTNPEAFGERVAIAVVNGLKDNTKGLRDVSRAYVK